MDTNGHSYACPLSSDRRPPDPMISDGYHTGLEQRFEEEVAREMKRHSAGKEMKKAAAAGK